MTRVLLAALLSAAVVLPAAAQNPKMRGIEPVRAERVATIGGPIQDQIYAPGLPGVALSASQTTDRPSGPGGLSNGVGGVGTLMPNSSSSNGQLLNDQGNGIGLPLNTPRRYVD
ncbi:hypothetical protein GCM10011390_42750 [Aureimonas endophytica]|uniref:Curli production assembly/transport component CsgF n=1 Tax=Aureimonas endophytica TaxID=2027858 RepID=A0A916ZYF6_9HYPH|nr:hypothetical protein [Aureimonas endophytica]GGE19029.1 hypothetical protein GCM10011390_42750 [Aureimonas endophytica]